MNSIKKILHPTDFSPASRFALDLAVSLARDRGAELILLHVVPMPVQAIGGDASILRRAEKTEGELRSYEEEMRAHLHRLAPRKLKGPVEHLLCEGDVVQEIIRVAEHTPCDLIVLGSHGKSESFAKLLGSVTEAVVRKAPCPVLVANTPHGAATETRGCTKETEPVMG